MENAYPGLGNVDNKQYGIALHQGEKNGNTRKCQRESKGTICA